MTAGRASVVAEGVEEHREEGYLRPEVATLMGSLHVAAGHDAAANITTTLTAIEAAGNDGGMHTKDMQGADHARDQIMHHAAAALVLEL